MYVHRMYMVKKYIHKREHPLALLIVSVIINPYFHVL